MVFPENQSKVELVGVDDFCVDKLTVGSASQYPISFSIISQLITYYFNRSGGQNDR